jgi:hypothetical protein
MGLPWRSRLRKPGPDPISGMEVRKSLWVCAGLMMVSAKSPLDHAVRAPHLSHPRLKFGMIVSITQDGIAITWDWHPSLTTVEEGDMVTPSQQAPRDRSTDIAGSADDQGFHALPLPCQSSHSSFATPNSPKGSVRRAS